jgi:Cytidylyltransferase-like
MATHDNNNSGSTRRDSVLRHYRSACGVSCTSVLQSQNKNGGVSGKNNSRRNSTAYLACRGSLSDDPTVGLHVELSSGGHNRSRFDEDVFVGHLVLTTLQLFEAVSMVDYDNDPANALPAGLTVVRSTTTTSGGDDLNVKTVLGDEIRIQIGRNRHSSTRARIEAAAERVLSGQDKVVLIRPNDDHTDFEVLHSAHLLQHSLIFPGSFNPPHRGHVALARASADAMDRCDMVYFEISITNPDKPSIPAAEVATRVLQFLDLDNNSTNGYNWGILLTDAPLFVQKATILAPRYGHLTFAIGSDTLVRLIDPKYYNDSPLQMLTVLHSMNCNYIVGGRVQQQKLPDAGAVGAFISGLELLKELPEALAARFQILPEFRVDISSTELRRLQHQQK